MSVTATDAISAMGLAQPTQAPRKTEMGSSEFLLLMMTQLKNQDPLKPMDSNAFLGQLAQMSTVSGIQGLQDSFNGLAYSMQGDQVLSAASLVNREVLVQGNQGYLAAEGPLNGAVDVSGSGEVFVEIKGESGAVIRRISLGTQSPGTADFVWDGMDAAGVRMPAGKYSVTATQTAGTSTTQLETLIAAKVKSVALSPQGILLNLFGLGAITLSDVRRIG